MTDVDTNDGTITVDAGGALTVTEQLATTNCLAGHHRFGYSQCWNGAVTLNSAGAINDAADDNTAQW